MLVLSDSRGRAGLCAIGESVPEDERAFMLFDEVIPLMKGSISEPYTGALLYGV